MHVDACLPVWWSSERYNSHFTQSLQLTVGQVLLVISHP